MKYFLIVSILCLSACEGGLNIQAPEGSTFNTVPESDETVPDPFPEQTCVGVACDQATISESSRVVRLTHTQWALSVKDLLKLESAPETNTFIDDPLSVGTFDNFALALEVSPGLWDDYRSAAEEIAVSVSSDPARLGALEANDAPEVLEGRILSLIEGLGRKAYRRRLTENEVAELVSLMDAVPEAFPGAPGFAQHAEFLIRSLLQSPHFLYRIELTTSASNIVDLSGDERASRLSYALWNSIPDAELLDAAESGKLETKQDLEAQVSRMMEDVKFENTVIDFHGQVFKFDTFHEIAKAPERFPNFKPELADMYRVELTEFIRHTIFETDGNWADLLNSRTAFVNAELASQYGVEGEFDATFKQTELPKERAGVLTRLGFLSKNANDYDPSPIARGLFVNEHITCSTLLPAPDEFTIPDGVEGNTNRELNHNATKECGAACHANINPPGYALENFDAMGILRTQENGFDIDTAATWHLEEKPFDFVDGVDLSNIISKSNQSHTCYTAHWFQYLFGRSPNDNDAPFIHQVGQASNAGTINIKETISLLVTSDLFLKRKMETK